MSYEVYQWSETDPSAALAFFATKYDPVEQPHPFVEAIKELAQDDPAAAARHAEVLQGKGREEGLTAVVKEWAFVDPMGAATFVGGLEDADERLEMAGVLTGNCREQDRDAVTAWAETLEGPEGERARLALDLTSWRAPGVVIADAFPQVKAAYLSLPEPERLKYRQPLSEMWSQWTATAPEEAAAQAVAWDEPLTKDRRYYHPMITTLQSWCAKDRPAAHNWVRAISEESERNAALVALALTYHAGSTQASCPAIAP